jgi:uncharacterized oligopeptide transporter (OPT) family protein
MKRETGMRWLTAAILVVVALISAPQTKAQVVNEATKKKISIGVGLFTDLWMNKPSDMKVRTINQGFQLNGMYSFPFGKSDLSFAIGLGIGVHNLYWNYLYQGRTDSLQFVKINDSLDYKRSKLTLPYLELPIEFRLKTKFKMAFGVGFKIGYMIYAHSKWKGDDYLFKTQNSVVASFKDIKNLEKFTFGPTLRVGYKWFHVFGYYQLSGIFTKGKGPDIAPLSIGFLLMPF